MIAIFFVMFVLVMMFIVEGLMSIEGRRVFPLRIILTITTGRLLTERKGDNDNGISDLYDILGHMTGESPYTHTLGRFAEECKPYLYTWFPELGVAEALLPSLDRWLLRCRNCPDEGVRMWLKELTMTMGCKSEYEIGQIPKARHVRKDPINELVEIRQAA